MGSAPQPAPESRSNEITQLLNGFHDDPEVQARLLPLVYDELHRIAQRHFGNERSDHTLQPTALVNEAYLQLVAGADRSWKNRSHFFAAAATSMRRVLVDHARRHRSAKRGGGVRKINLEDAVIQTGEQSDEILALDEALSKLAGLDPRQSQIVELRYFAGFGGEDIARLLGISRRTVEREWELARKWLYLEISGGA